MSPATPGRITAVLDAAGALCRSAGLLAAGAHRARGEDGPRVLDARANVVVALPGGSLVARCPAATDLLPGQRPQDPWRLTGELALAGWLAARGAPVVPPAGPGDPLDAGPHLVDGLTLTIWRRADPVPPALATPDAYGRVLAELHGAAAGYPEAGTLAPLGPAVDDVAAVLDALERRADLPAGLTRRIRAVAADVAAELLGGADRSGWLALHGDAHPRNLLSIGGRLVWNDLEDCCLGPPEWDLATMLATTVQEGPAAVRAYGRDPDEPALEPYLRGRALERLAWTAVGAAREPPGPARAAGIATVTGLLETLERKTGGLSGWG